MVSGRLVCWEISPVWCSGQALLKSDSTWLLLGLQGRALPWTQFSSLDSVLREPTRSKQEGLPSQPVLQTGTFQDLMYTFLLAGLPCGFRLCSSLIEMWQVRNFPSHTPGHWGVLVGWAPGRRQARCVIRPGCPAWWWQPCLPPLPSLIHVESARSVAFGRCLAMMHPMCMSCTCVQLCLSEKLPGSMDFISKWIR